MHFGIFWDRIQILWFLEFLFTFACILHASGHLHELTNFGIDLTSILSLMISPQTSSKFSDYILLLGADSEGKPLQP